jgi:glycosyltransferase involved in cell wall biosynthesis
MNKLLIYGAPGNLGGAATKIRDLLRMLVNDFEITVVLPEKSFLKCPETIGFIEGLKIPYCLRRDVPERVDGVALGICDPDIFTSGTANEIRRRGMRFVWSNEMMWEFKGEAEAVRSGVVDRALFLSEIQQDAFRACYQGVDQVLIRNYVTPSDFPLVERTNETIVVGRLSRADPVKYPIDFPVFYEELGLNPVKYKVMAWSAELAKLFSWHKFGSEWELLPERRMPAPKFLSGLDLFVYPLGHRFIESWGRSTLEAMLTGCIPLVPSGHQFHNMMVHEESGFICKSFGDFRYYAQELFRDGRLRRRMSQRTADYARSAVCDFDAHKRAWIHALTFSA